MDLSLILNPEVDDALSPLSPKGEANADQSKLAATAAKAKGTTNMSLHHKASQMQFQIIELQKDIRALEAAITSLRAKITSEAAQLHELEEPLKGLHNEHYDSFHSHCENLEAKMAEDNARTGLTLEPTPWGFHELYLRKGETRKMILDIERQQATMHLSRISISKCENKLQVKVRTLKYLKDYLHRLTNERRECEEKLLEGGQ